MIRPGSATAEKLLARHQQDTDLKDELWAALDRAKSPAAQAWRERMGWPKSAVLQGLGGGVSRIEFNGDTYQPSAREGVGTAAIIVPVWAGRAPGLVYEQPIDLLAWVPGSGVYTRLGIAEVLGEEAIRKAEFYRDRPLMVYPDPGAWARAHTWADEGDHGAVVLDWSRAWGVLGHLPTVAASDVPTAERLAEALKPPAPHRPSVMVHRIGVAA